MPLKIPEMPTDYELAVRRHTMLTELASDLADIENELTAFAKERERLGAYGADAAAIMDVANRQVQFIQLLRRAIGTLQK